MLSCRRLINIYIYIYACVCVCVLSQILLSKLPPGTVACAYIHNIIHPQVFAYLLMRDKLSQILLSKLPPGTVQGNKRLAQVEQRNNNAVCKFSDGSSEEFDLVIGCDGINSVVRQHVVGVESPPVYSGIRYYECCEAVLC